MSDGCGDDGGPTKSNVTGNGKHVGPDTEIINLGGKFASSNWVASYTHPAASAYDELAGDGKRVC